MECIRDEFKRSGVGEGAKIRISRDQGRSLIQTALGDERVAKPRLSLLPKHLGAERSRPLPEPRFYLDERNPKQFEDEFRGESRFTQKLGEHRRRHQ